MSAKQKRKGGAPAKEFNEKLLQDIMRFKPSLADTAALFSCEERTVQRYIERKHSMTFSEYRERHMVHTRQSLVRAAIDRALAGSDTMLIFCLKNLCDWRNEAPSTLVQVKAEANVTNESDKKMVQEFKEVLAGYLGERKESA